MAQLEKALTGPVRPEKVSIVFLKDAYGKTEQGKALYQGSKEHLFENHILPRSEPAPLLVLLSGCVMVALRGLSGCSVGKEPACNAEDCSSTPGSGRSAGEGIGYPLRYSWASLVTQLVKNPPAMPETWVRSLSWEDALKKGIATHSSILLCKVHGRQRVRHD